MTKHDGARIIQRHTIALESCAPKFGRADSGAGSIRLSLRNDPLAPFLTNHRAAARAFTTHREPSHATRRLYTDDKADLSNYDANVRSWPLLDNSAALRTRFLDNVIICKGRSYTGRESSCNDKRLHIALLQSPAH